jgi:hypothetical protein
MAVVRNSLMVEMSHPSDRYEIYLEGAPSWRAASSSIARWNWCRISPDAVLVERGSGYASLPLCYAAVAIHNTDLPDALVEINLMHVPPPEPLPVVQQEEPQIAYRRRA